MHIRLEAGADHVEELAHEKNPIQAVIELVWNSLDAEARWKNGHGQGGAAEQPPARVAGRQRSPSGRRK